MFYQINNLININLDGHETLAFDFFFTINKLESWTVQRVQDETKIKAQLLLQVLCILFKRKVIECQEINDKELDELNENDIRMNYNIQLLKDFER